MQLFLAHQGGWDELLMFLLPIALVVATWFVLERRRSRGSGQKQSTEPNETEPPHSSD